MAWLCPSFALDDAIGKRIHGGDFDPDEHGAGIMIDLSGLEAVEHASLKGETHGKPLELHLCPKENNQSRDSVVARSNVARLGRANGVLAENGAQARAPITICPW